jgi:hypothetical protein
MFEVSPLRKLLALSQRERKLLAEAAVLLPSVHLLQQALPFRHWRSLLTRTALGAQCGEAGGPKPDELAHAVERARRGLPGEYKCLPAAYTLHILMHRYGYDSRVQVGVAHAVGGAVEAHAWVEYEGRVLIGALPDLMRFVPLPPLKV